jgi:hypothetical protein
LGDSFVICPSFVPGELLPLKKSRAVGPATQQ